MAGRGNDSGLERETAGVAIDFEPARRLGLSLEILERETAGVATDFGPARRFELKKIGAGNRVRTGDLNLGKVALYQLSYSRITMRVSTAVVAGTGETGRPRLGVPPQPWQGCALPTELFPRVAACPFQTPTILCRAGRESRTIAANSCKRLNYKVLSLALITSQAACR